MTNERPVTSAVVGTPLCGIVIYSDMFIGSTYMTGVNICRTFRLEARWPRIQLHAGWSPLHQNSGLNWGEIGAMARAGSFRNRNRDYFVTVFCHICRWREWDSIPRVREEASR
jgi:hypothetical protein